MFHIPPDMRIYPVMSNVTKDDFDLDFFVDLSLQEHLDASKAYEEGVVLAQKQLHEKLRAEECVYNLDYMKYMEWVHG